MRWTTTGLQAGVVKRTTAGAATETVTDAAESRTGSSGGCGRGSERRTGLPEVSPGAAGGGTTSREEVDDDGTVGGSSGTVVNRDGDRGGGWDNDGRDGSGGDCGRGSEWQAGPPEVSPGTAGGGTTSCDAVDGNGTAGGSSGAGVNRDGDRGGGWDNDGRDGSGGGCGRGSERQAGPPEVSPGTAGGGDGDWGSDSGIADVVSGTDDSGSGDSGAKSGEVGVAALSAGNSEGGAESSPDRIPTLDWSEEMREEGREVSVRISAEISGEADNSRRMLATSGELPSGVRGRESGDCALCTLVATLLSWIPISGWEAWATTELLGSGTTASFRIPVSSRSSRGSVVGRGGKVGRCDSGSPCVSVVALPGWIPILGWEVEATSESLRDISGQSLRIPVMIGAST